MVAVDQFTKYAEVKAVRACDAITAAGFIFNRVICRHGAPAVLLSDQGSEWHNTLLEGVTRLARSRKELAPAHHHQGNGGCERFIGTFQGMLAAYTDRHAKNWDEFVHVLSFAYNTARHSSTGEAPFFLNYGRDAVLPALALAAEAMPEGVARQDVRTWIAERSVALDEGMARAQDALRAAGFESERKVNVGNQLGAHSFSPGDRAWLWKPDAGLGNKIRAQWAGPYRVVGVAADDMVVVAGRLGRWKATPVHASLLRRFSDPAERPVQPPEMADVKAALASADGTGGPVQLRMTGLGEGALTSEAPAEGQAAAQADIAADWGDGSPEGRGTKRTHTAEAEEGQGEGKRGRVVGRKAEVAGAAPVAPAAAATAAPAAATAAAKPEPRTMADVLDGTQEFLVHDIVDAEMRGKEKFYRATWVGFGDPREDTWLPAAECGGCAELVAEFEAAMLARGWRAPQRDSGDEVGERPASWRTVEEPARRRTTGAGRPRQQRQRRRGRH